MARKAARKKSAKKSASKKKVAAKKSSKRPAKKKAAPKRRATARKSKPAKVSHPGMMGDGAEEQNLNEAGNPSARVTEAEVDAAFKPTRSQNN